MIPCAPWPGFRFLKTMTCNQENKVVQCLKKKTRDGRKFMMWNFLFLTQSITAASFIGKEKYVLPTSRGLNIPIKADERVCWIIFRFVQVHSFDFSHSIFNLEQEYDICWTVRELHQENKMLPQEGKVSWWLFCVVHRDWRDWVDKKPKWLVSGHCVELVTFMWVFASISRDHVPAAGNQWAANLLGSCQRCHPSHPVNPASNLASIGSTQLPLPDSNRNLHLKGRVHRQQRSIWLVRT